MRRVHLKPTLESPMSTLHIPPGPIAPHNSSWKLHRRHFRSSLNPHIYLSLDSHSPVSNPSASITSQRTPFPSSSSSQKLAPPLARLPILPVVVTPSGSSLKPSLKSTHSSPAVLAVDHPHRHDRATSLSTPKTVKFKDRDAGLESVRIYKPTGRPARLLLTSGSLSDTETETESDIPLHTRPRSLSLPVPPARLELDAARTSALCKVPPADANICIESFTLLPSLDNNPVFQGSILVRNIAFQKLVNIRFTLDEWDTVSEVHATYSGHALYAANGTSKQQPESHSWDRFKFSITLPGDPVRLHMRRIAFAAHYKVDGQGEWWDNNKGANYSAHFRLALSLPVIAARSTAGPRRRRMITSAPPTRPTPQVQAVQAVQEQAMGVFVKTAPMAAGPRDIGRVFVRSQSQ
ncbi:putative phosphatase regulatory subunit-domain-containing protein [Amylostereum chailletii]|nr:putative phosphatase regulatory subunit-domain-containing protein [Amylostereum chailletii]